MQAYSRRARDNAGYEKCLEHKEQGASRLRDPPQSTFRLVV